MRCDSVANRRKTSRKGANVEKVDNGLVAAVSTFAAPVEETQVNGELKESGSAAVFSTILQTARQTGQTSIPDAARRKAAISGFRKAMVDSEPESKVMLEAFAATRSGAKFSAPQETVSPVVTVPIDGGILRKALSPVVSGQVISGKNGTVADQKVASPTTAPRANDPTIAPDKAAMQIIDANRSAIRSSDVARNIEIPAPSLSVQTQVSGSDGNRIERSVKPHSGYDARIKIAPRTGSGQQATVTASASPGVLRKQFGALSEGVDRQARFVVKELTAGGGDNNAAGEIAGVETARAEASARGAAVTDSPVKQIAEAFRSSAASNGRDIVVHLDPPELGRVRVMLRIEGAEVRGVLEVENPRTLSQLQREAPNIISRLTEAGVDMKRMDLSLNENAMRDSMRDSAWFSQQYGENGPSHGGWGSSGQGSAVEETLPDRWDGQGELSPVLTTIDSGSINIWI